MMMIAKAIAQVSPRSSIRPFNPQRDLAALANLIEVAFRDELAATGSRIVQDMRQMALFGPVLSLTSMAVPPFSGYVWLENGQLVGNASLSCENEELGIWLISNVAVLPAFRGRGIASSLLDTAIDHVRRYNGTRILLQVRAVNQAALELYRRRGFVTYDTLHELNLDVPQGSLLIGHTQAPLRDVSAADGHSLYALAVASTPGEVQRRRPICPQRFRRGLGWRLRRMMQTTLGTQQPYERVGEVGHQLVAYARVVTHLTSGPHELELRVLPTQRGHWELALVEECLRCLRDLAPYNLRTYVSASHPEALDALRQAGFQTLRVLDQMSLWLT
jgi:ribosomal protein S18 acetylase RimI-like enzyme